MRHARQAARKLEIMAREGADLIARPSGPPAAEADVAVRAEGEAVRAQIEPDARAVEALAERAIEKDVRAAEPEPVAQQPPIGKPEVERRVIRPAREAALQKDNLAPAGVLVQGLDREDRETRPSVGAQVIGDLEMREAEGVAGLQRGDGAVDRVAPRPFDQPRADPVECGRIALGHPRDGGAHLVRAAHLGATRDLARGLEGRRALGRAPPCKRDRQQRIERIENCVAHPSAHHPLERDIGPPGVEARAKRAQFILQAQAFGRERGRIVRCLLRRRGPREDKPEQEGVGQMNHPCKPTAGERAFRSCCCAHDE